MGFCDLPCQFMHSMTSCQKAHDLKLDEAVCILSGLSSQTHLHTSVIVAENRGEGGKWDIHNTS